MDQHKIRQHILEKNVKNLYREEKFHTIALLVHQFPTEVHVD